MNFITRAYTLTLPSDRYLRESICRGLKPHLHDLAGDYNFTQLLQKVEGFGPDLIKTLEAGLSAVDKIKLLAAPPAKKRR